MEVEYVSSLVFAEPNKYQCTRGHTWTAAYLYAGISVTLPNDERTYNYCLYCLQEFLTANLGIVEEVK